MKNGQQKKQDKHIKIDLKGEDTKKYLFIAFFGLLSAIVMQGTAGPERFLGGFLVALILFYIVYRDIFRYRPKYIESMTMLLLLGSITVGTLALGGVSNYILKGLLKGLDISAGGTSVFGLPLAMGAVLVTLLFDFHTAIVVTFVISLLTGLWFEDAALSIYVFVGSLASAFSVIRCKRRSDILKAGLVLFMANSVTVLAINLTAGEIFSLNTPFALAFGAVSALGVVALVSILLPILERLFSITTDISLLELLDLEHPLMKALMINAPGTYHHSIVVGNLVESVAEDVGVNPLLARVCAYFHDIGKVKMPDYFVENQASGASRHDRLSPHMSTMVLTSHVKEGVDLARQYKLPQAVIDIIEQHHGTSIITYFYEKAKGQQPEELSEDEYRYPGPRPQSKLGALVMMADAVDAASRVLTEPTPQRITGLVNKIINHILIEGQLDDCELTLKDINRIKGRFIYILTGVLHKRIDYPGFNFNEVKSDEGTGEKQPKADKAEHAEAKEEFAQSARPSGTSWS